MTTSPSLLLLFWLSFVAAMTPLAAANMQWICPIYYIRSVCQGMSNSNNNSNRSDRDRGPESPGRSPVYGPTRQIPVATPTAPTYPIARPVPRPNPAPRPSPTRPSWPSSPSRPSWPSRPSRPSWPSSPSRPTWSKPTSGGNGCNSNPTTSTNSQYDVSFDFKNVHSSHQSLFRQAANRWRRVIIGDVMDTSMVTGYSRCNKPWPNKIDDVHICAVYQDIDGPSGTLGFARPILRRAAGDSPLTAAGEMVFDSADAGFGNSGEFLQTVIHEMGHVLGLGTLWPAVRVQPGRRVPCPYSANSKASRQWKCLTGCNSPIPVEQDTGSAGSDCGHWKQNCLLNEIMTPFQDRNPPLSSLSVASLEDLGYKVNYNGADPFPASNIHPSCRCNNNRALRGTNETTTAVAADGSIGWPQHSRKLSKAQQEAKSAAEEFGRNILRKAAEEEEYHLEHLSAAEKAQQEAEIAERIATKSTSREQVELADPIVSVLYMDPDMQIVRGVIVRLDE